MQDYRKLDVWKKAHFLAAHVYKAAAPFPKEEMFTPASQIRRVGALIPANIAERCGRGSNFEPGHFLQISPGSAHGLEYHLSLAGELGYLKQDESVKLGPQVNEIKRGLAVLIKKNKAEHLTK